MSLTDPKTFEARLGEISRFRSGYQGDDFHSVSGDEKRGQAFPEFREAIRTLHATIVERERRVVELERTLEKQPCNCVMTSSPQQMSAEALESGAIYEVLQQCQRCAALAHKSTYLTDKPTPEPPDVTIADTRITACPFCGSSSPISWQSHDASPSMWAVFCQDCEAEGPHTKDRQEAITLWNKRASFADKIAEAKRKGAAEALEKCSSQLLSSSKITSDPTKSKWQEAIAGWLLEQANTNEAEAARRAREEV